MSAADAVGDDDGGRQAERTALAHWRTTFATAIAGLLIVRQSDAGFERVVALLGALGALLTVAAVGFVRQAAFDRGDTAARPRQVACITGALVVMEVVALVVVV